MRTSPPPSNPLFALTSMCAGVFCVTLLAFVAAWYGNPQAPAARFLDRHGGRIISVEVALVIGLGLLSLVVDRRQTLRARREGPDRQDQPRSAEPSSLDDTAASSSGKGP